MKQPLLSPLNDPMKDKDFFKKLPFPLMGSPKFDGIRSVNPHGMMLSRSMKAIRSKQVQDRFRNLWHTDGELIVGDPFDDQVYNTTNSHVMSADKPADDLRYFIFDFIRSDQLMLPFFERSLLAKELVEGYRRLFPGIFFVEHEPLDDLDALLAYEQTQLALGFEGIMLRTPLGMYKTNARATWNDEIIYKLKRFTDDEAKITGFVEAMKNNNSVILDERGYSKRSQAKGLETGLGRVGKFIVDYKGQELKISPGKFTHDDLVDIWNHQDFYLGKFLKFRFFAYGMKDLPRFPRAVGFRSVEDM